ncbi:MAG: nitroreductase [Clostridiales bacterium]|nr:nitroreductase [Clostridiales bacterium]
MRSAINERISRRTFEKSPLSTNEQEKIIQMVEKSNARSGLSSEFLEDGSAAFDSIKKSYGMFKNARSLLLMKGEKNDVHLLEKVGYYGEELVLDLTDMKLGTCWVAGTFDKTQFTAPDSEEIVCVILVGKVSNVTPKEKLIRYAISKNRKPISKRLIATAEVPDWVVKGIESVRLAPSARNTQKTTFHYDGNTLTVNIPNDYPMDLVDLGISKKHFEIEANGKFELGNGATFQMSKI